MTIQTTYTQARADLASLWDEVTLNCEIVIIERRGAEPVALISADELEGLMETAYLLRSPKNVERLLTALGRAQRKEGAPTESLPQGASHVRQAPVGIGDPARLAAGVMCVRAKHH